jgi:hypothetical protein
MKPARDSAALAASLTQAAKTPLPLPGMPPEGAAVPANESIGRPDGYSLEERNVEIAGVRPPKKVAKQKIVSETVQVTLRPRRGLLERYIVAAADRTREEMKPISPQQIMLEVLERGLRGR